MQALVAPLRQRLWPERPLEGVHVDPVMLEPAR